MSRKDIAALTGLTMRQVELSERKWGLSAARIRLKTRNALYDAAKVALILRNAGLSAPGK